MSERKKLDHHHREDAPSYKQNLTYEQRKELTSLMKRMLPPQPTNGIIDIRFSFWLFRKFYIVFIFGRDLRSEFRADDHGDMDRSLIFVAKAFTYVFLAVMLIILTLALLYILKSVLGIDIMPDKHLSDFLPFLQR